MSRDLDAVEFQELEKLVDKVGLQSVLMGLSEICGLKDEHIQADWQDYGLARRWAYMCGAIGVLVPNAHNL